MKTIKITDEAKLKTSEIFEECKKLFPCYSYYDNEKLDKDFPVPKKPTERYFLNKVEPDKDTLGKSAKEADPNIKGITIRERMLMEIAYFTETGGHLDIKGITFCSGSRDSDGGVPRAGWDFGRFRVGWSGLDGSGSGFGIRSEVSLDTFNFLPLNFDEVVKICKEAGCRVIRSKTVEEEL